MVVETYVPRDMSRLAAEALRTMPVVVVTGLRQCGKTTFLQSDPAFAGYRYHTLDDFAVLQAAQREPEALLEDETPVIVDEVQRCPELLLAVKRAVDRRRRAGRFVLSGSANLALLAGASESLAGRAVYLTLPPFTRRERRTSRSAEPFLRRLLTARGGETVDTSADVAHADVVPLRGDEVLAGGLPPVALGLVPRRDLWLRGYEQTYLERDVQQLARIADLPAFRNLLRLAALRSGQLLNQSELARDARLPLTTVGRHLGLLEASFVLSRLTPFLRNRATRLVKSPKLYLSDSGLAAHLAGVEDVEATADEPLRGALVETYVHQQLAGLLAAHAESATLGFWIVHGRHEVDFVVGLGRRVVAIEVKAATRFVDRDLSGLRAFAAATPALVAGLMAYNGTEAVRLEGKLHAVPLGLLLS